MNGGDVDVAVVGAGPAGSAAALALARVGVRVALFERTPMPREKICGDLLGTEAVACVARLGLARILDGATPVRGAILHGPGGARYGAVGRERPAARARATAACVVTRRTFDAALLDAARDAGADVRFERVAGVVRGPGGRIAGVATSAGTCRATITIGTDGWGSVVGRALDGDRAPARNVAVVARAYADGVADLAGRMHFFVNPAGDGYGWIFPLGDRGANVGLGFVRGEGAHDLATAFARFRSERSLAAPYLAGATYRDVGVWPIPLGPCARRRAAPGALLAGDAAWLASPLSGSGIANALASGTLAARFAMRTLRGDDAAWRAYERRLATRLALRLHVEAALHRTLGTPRHVDRAARLTRIPALGAALSRALLALG